MSFLIRRTVRHATTAVFLIFPFSPASTSGRAVNGVTFATSTSVSLSSGLQGMIQPLRLSGTGSAIMGKTRVELDKVENVGSTVTPGDVLLAASGTGPVVARPSLKTYTNMTAPLQDQLARLTDDAGDGVHGGDVPARFERIGTGETIDGRPTVQYRLTTKYSAEMPQHSVAVAITIDVWAAKLPVAVNNPLLSFGTVSSTPIGAFRQKLAAAFATLGDETPVKTVVTTTLSVAENTHEIVQTTLLTDVKPASVDPATLAVPAGFTASAR